MSQPHTRSNYPSLAAWILQVPGFLLFGLLSLGSRRRKMIGRFALPALMIGLVLFSIACGGASSTKATPTPAPSTMSPGTYTLLVTASSGSLSHNLPLTLTVQ